MYMHGVSVMYLLHIKNTSFQLYCFIYHTTKNHIKTYEINHQHIITISYCEQITLQPSFFPVNGHGDHREEVSQTKKWKLKIEKQQMVLYMNIEVTLLTLCWFLIYVKPPEQYVLSLIEVNAILEIPCFTILAWLHCIKSICICLHSTHTRELQIK
jgi:hypothetical protein